MGDKIRQRWEPEIWARPLSATCARAAKLRMLYIMEISMENQRIECGKSSAER
jgi:hypothetical protein